VDDQDVVDQDVVVQLGATAVGPGEAPLEGYGEPDVPQSLGFTRARPAGALLAVAVEESGD
jgi:hypothetical protein